MTPLDIIEFIREKYSESLFFKVNVFQKEKNNNKIGESVNKKKFVKQYEDEEIISILNCRQLYLKLYPEEFCIFFPYITNFKKLYELLELIGMK